MHKYQPRVHVVRCGVDSTTTVRRLDDVDRSRRKTFVFAETAFTAVTAYQNQLVRRAYSSALETNYFAPRGPRLWNDLPPGLRRPGLAFDSFGQSPKTHLFADRSAQ